jgi:thiol-disulfide isomerase/thioredoxin
MAKSKPINYRMFLAALLIVIIFFLVFLSFRTYKVEKFIEAEKTVHIVLVYAEWCPHCHTYLKTKTFEQAKNKIMAMPEFKGKVDFDVVESDANPSRVKLLGITGFPSIVASVYEDGIEKKLSDFSGNRENIDDLTEFTRASLHSAK